MLACCAACRAAVRRAWVEIVACLQAQLWPDVALCAEGVGRNTSDTLRKYFHNRLFSMGRGVDQNYSTKLSVSNKRGEGICPLLFVIADGSFSFYEQLCR